MTKRKILLSVSITGALFLVLFLALMSGGNSATVQAQPAPDPGQKLAAPGDEPLFSQPQTGVNEVSPNAAQGLDFQFIKSVTFWHDGQGSQDCDAVNWNNRELVVNYGDLVRYCYYGKNIGATTIVTHTIFDEGLNSYAMKDHHLEMPPGGFLKFYTRQITITEESVGKAWWEVIDENQNHLTKYQSTLVKVAIRFRGYAFDAMPGDPSPKPKLENVELQLFGWNEGEQMGTSPLVTTTSDTGGFWNFYMPDTYDYYRIVAIPPEGYVNVDAWAENAVKVDAATLEWHQPDRSIVQSSQFYFGIPTPTPTPTLTPTITPTPTVTPTPPPGMEPGIWLPVVLQ